MGLQKLVGGHDEIARVTSALTVNHYV